MNHRVRRRLAVATVAASLTLGGCSTGERDHRVSDRVS